ncbi:MAG: zinc-binding dehydrogenase [Clostridia bacterium]|nr:zinc-binding dehydrogenase [Clostridia bacterium]
MAQLPDKITFGAIMEPKVAELHQYDFPVVGPEDVVIKMLTNNICTTDYQHWAGLRNHQGFPMAGGHEWAGIIVDKGKDVISDLEIGMQVGLMSNGCGMCFNCRHGRTSDCTNTKGRNAGPGPDGFRGNKCFANYLVFNQNRILHISNDIPPAQAGFLEPVATVVRGIKKVNVKPMEDVVIIGAGTMGLVNAQVAKAWGARVIITEIDPKKLERARSMGFADVVDAKANDPVEAVKDLTGGGADCVIAAVGATIAYKQGYQMLKPLRGRLSLFPAGFPKPELQVDPNELHYRKIEIIGTIGADTVDFVDSATLISKRLVDCSYSLEGAVFPLRDLQKAYELAATPGTYRVTVDLQGV